MRIKLDLSVSLKIDMFEGEIVDTEKLISSNGDLSVELDGYSGITQIRLFNKMQGHFDLIYIVGSDLDIKDIRPKLLQYVNDNHSQIANIEVEMNDDYYQLTGDPVRDIKKSIQTALDENNWEKIAELAKKLI